MALQLCSPSQSSLSSSRHLRERALLRWFYLCACVPHQNANSLRIARPCFFPAFRQCPGHKTGPVKHSRANTGTLRFNSALSSSPFPSPSGFPPHPPQPPALSKVCKKQVSPQEAHRLPLLAAPEVTIAAQLSFLLNPLPGLPAQFRADLLQTRGTHQQPPLALHTTACRDTLSSL